MIHRLFEFNLLLYGDFPKKSTVWQQLPRVCFLHLFHNDYSASFLLPNRILAYHLTSYVPSSCASFTILQQIPMFLQENPSCRGVRFLYFYLDHP